MIAIDELETGRGENQICSLKRAGDKRWSSYFNSISSLIKKFQATLKVIQNIINEGYTYSQCGYADVAYFSMMSFEFVFILCLVREIMGATDSLCQALQQQTQDILNAMHLSYYDSSNVNNNYRTGFLQPKRGPQSFSPLRTMIGNLNTYKSISNKNSLHIRAEKSFQYISILHSYMLRIS